jgi:hypothetical protein
MRLRLLRLALDPTRLPGLWTLSEAYMPRRTTLSRDRAAVAHCRTRFVPPLDRSLTRLRICSLHSPLIVSLARAVARFHRSPRAILPGTVCTAPHRAHAYAACEHDLQTRASWRLCAGQRERYGGKVLKVLTPIESDHSGFARCVFLTIEIPLSSVKMRSIIRTSSSRSYDPYWNTARHLPVRDAARWGRLRDILRADVIHVR